MHQNHTQSACFSQILMINLSLESNSVSYRYFRVSLIQESGKMAKHVVSQVCCPSVLCSSAAAPDLPIRKVLYFTTNSVSLQPDQTCPPLITAFCDPCVKIKLANSCALPMVWSCLCRSRARITAPGLWFDHFVPVSRDLYSPPRNEHPVPGTWLGGGF